MGTLEGKKICVTGKLSLSRKEVQGKLKALGASISSGVTASTDLLVAGDKAGSKLVAADKHGVPVIGQAGLDALLEGQSLDAVLGVAAPAKAAPAEKPAAAKTPAAAAPAGKPHEGQTFVLTGDLDIDRSVAKRQLQALGARVTGSVSGKTTALLCGDEPGGSKVSKAHSKGIPVLEKAAVAKLLAGAALDEVVAGGGSAAEAETAPTQRTPLPDLPERVRDGAYRRVHDDGSVTEGAYRGGRAHGTWKGFWPNGQLKWELPYVDGLRHGTERGFHDSGERRYEGEYREDRQEGPWTYWYDDGSFQQCYRYQGGQKHGDYEYDERDGTPRARGRFVDGRHDGPWEWRNQKSHELVNRGYLRGMFHGMSEAWYHGGQLAYRKEYDHSGLAGVFEEYYEDGKPKKKGQYTKDRQLVRMESWDEDGQSTVEEGGSKGLPDELVGDSKKLEKVAARLAKAKDEYKKEEVLEKAAGGYQNRYPLLVHLFREGLYDLAGDPALWRFLAENAQELTGEDVARLLKGAKVGKDTHSPHLPGWPGALDEIVMRVYARDPAPIDAVADELKGMLKVGVAFCRARFGKDVGKAIGDRAKDLAKQVVENHGLGDRILWPEGEGVEWRDLLKGNRRDEPTEHFGPFLELLTTSDSFEEAMLAAALKSCEKDHRSLWLPKIRPALRRATPEQLGKLLDQASLGDELVDVTEQLFFEWREDDAETIAGIAMGSEETGLRRWPMVACAILALKKEGKPVPAELLDALELDGGSISMMWVDTAIRAAVPDEKKRHDLAFLAEAVTFADHDAPGFPRNRLLVRALRALDEDQRRRVIERQLENKYGKQNAAPYLFLVEDEDFWKSTIASIAESEYGGGHSVAFGLGMLPLSALPLIAAGKKKAKKKNQDAYDRAALLCVTRALERGESLDAKATEAIRFDLGGKYDWSYVMPVLRKAVHALPREQGEAILLEGLEPAKRQTFARAFRFIGSHPTPAVLAKAMNGLLDVESTLKQDDERDIEAGLRSLADSRDYLKWLVANGGGSKLGRVFENVAGGRDKYEELKKEIAAGGGEVAEELDAVGKLQALAERVRKKASGGPMIPIYVLRHLEEEPAKPTLNRTGGLPPGIDTERWPTKDEEPMVHLFTLDLDTMPELKTAHGGARTLSFFCWSPGHNEAWDAGNDQTALLAATAEQATKEGEPPEEAEVRAQKPFEAIRVEVPVAVFSSREGSLGELRGAIYSMGARVLGDPLWLQGDEGGSAGFVMQFDESFVDINLGDMGIMYVYDGGGFWQCH